MNTEETISWRIQTQPGGGYVKWRPGYGLPMRFRSVIDAEELPFTVELEIETTAGNLVCQRIAFVTKPEGNPVSAREIRAVPIAECIRLATAAAAAPMEEADGQVKFSLGGLGDISDRVKLAQAPDKRVSDSHLLEVARIYNSADSKPTKYVHEFWEEHRWPVSYSTVARWVSAARKRGFIAPRKSRNQQPTSGSE